MSKKRVVVSLGHDALGYTTTEQWDAVKVTAKALADLVEADYQLTITHSNGPQVSMIHKAMTELRRVYIDYTPAPMCVCSAMSQGYVGYDIQNSLRAELLDRGISKPVSTILTQVTVDPYDEAFYEPTKVIGRYMSKEDAEIEVKKGNYVKEDPGKGFRRVVAAPKPIDIVEIEAIRALAAADQVVIACGGGGIPVIEQKHALKGASAVIEKDAIAGKLASDLSCDELIILTSVPCVYKNYSKEDQTALETLTVAEAKTLMAEGQFEEGTMLPKIEAAISYLEKVPAKQGFMTSSCCPAFLKLIKTQVPEAADKISDTPSPMLTCAELIKEKYPYAVTVFIGPCIAKKVEAREHRETINYVLTFEEIMCMLEGKDIKFAEMSGDTAYERDASKLGLSFPLTAGVSAAVQDTVAAMGGEVHNAQYCSGLDKCRDTVKAAAAGKLDCSYIEGMACSNGCIDGPAAVGDFHITKVALTKYAAAAPNKQAAEDKHTK